MSCQHWFQQVVGSQVRVTAFRVWLFYIMTSSRRSSIPMNPSVRRRCHRALISSTTTLSGVDLLLGTSEENFRWSFFFVYIFLLYLVLCKNHSCHHYHANCTTLWIRTLQRMLRDSSVLEIAQIVTKKMKWKRAVVNGMDLSCRICHKSGFFTTKSLGSMRFVHCYGLNYKAIAHWLKDASSSSVCSH